jgi:hypothetical protein
LSGPRIRSLATNFPRPTPAAIALALSATGRVSRSCACIGRRGDVHAARACQPSSPLVSHAAASRVFISHGHHRELTPAVVSSHVQARELHITEEKLPEPPAPFSIHQSPAGALSRRRRFSFFGEPMLLVLLYPFVCGGAPVTPLPSRRTPTESPSTTPPVAVAGTLRTISELRSLSPLSLSGSIWSSRPCQAVAL